MPIEPFEMSRLIETWPWASLDRASWGSWGRASTDSVTFFPLQPFFPPVTMPDGTEEDVDETPREEPSGGEGTETEEPSRPPEGFADEGTTVGAWSPDTPSGYWRISAVLLAAVAVLGLIINAVGGNYAYVPNVEAMENILVFDWAHDAVHVVLALIAIVFGFTGLRTSDASKPTAGVIGVVYLALGIAGFFGGFVDLLDNLVGLHLEIGENVLHLVLGGWGAYVGFLSDAPY